MWFSIILVRSSPAALCSTVCIVNATEELCTLYLDNTSSQCNTCTIDTTIFWCPCMAINVSVQYDNGATLFCRPNVISIGEPVKMP